MNAVRISGKEKGAIEIKKITLKRLCELDGKHRKLVVRVFKNMVAKLATFIVPTDPRTLVRDEFGLFDPINREKDTLLNCWSMCMKDTHNKRMLRSIAVCLYSSFEAKRIISEDVRSHSEAVRAPHSRPVSAKRLSETKKERISGFPVRVNGSKQRRLGAVLSELLMTGSSSRSMDVCLNFVEL